MILDRNEVTDILDRIFVTDRPNNHRLAIVLLIPNVPLSDMWK